MMTTGLVFAACACIGCAGNELRDAFKPNKTKLWVALSLFNMATSLFGLSAVLKVLGWV